MAKIPTKYDISPVGNLASNRPMAQVDLGGEARGMQQAGAGLQNLGSSITAIGAQQAKQDRLIQGTQAETDLATDRAAREEALRNDTDYGTLTQRWAKDDGAAIQRAALRIKDPKTRELFTLEQQKSGLGYNKRLSAVADAGIKDGRIATLETAWQKSHDLIANPATPDDVRTRTKTELDASITEGAKAGVFSEQYANDLRRKYVDGADYALAGSLVKTPDGNRAVLPPQADDKDVLTKFLAPGKDAESVSGMKPPLQAGLAAMLRDAPPDIQKTLGIFSGYRSPERQAQLWEAAKIKYGSEDAARKWVAPPGRSKHNEGDAADLSFDGAGTTSKLTPAGKAAQEWAHANAAKYGLSFPLANEPWHVEAAGARGGNNGASPSASTDPDSVFGRMIHRESAGDPGALSPKGAQGLTQLMPATARETAAEMGISLPHSDAGLYTFFKTPAGQEANLKIGRAYFDKQLKAFGGDTEAAVIAYNAGPGVAQKWLAEGRSDSVLPKETLDYRNIVLRGGGTSYRPTTSSPYDTAYQNLRARFPNLSAEQIDNLATSAVTAKNGFAVQDRAAVEQAVQDGPSALANTGRYDGPTLDRGKFQEVYGQEGDRRFNAYDAAMKTAKSTFDMQTQSQTDIMAQVEAARTLVQTTTGEGADLADKRLSALQTAAAATIKARENDPPAAAMQAFPVVKQAWDAVTANPGDPQAFANAIKVTNAAQEQWGLAAEKRRVLPGSIADGIVEKLKMKDLEPSKALATLGQAVFATNDPLQQEAIFDQLKKAGVPAEAEGALRALHDGRTGDARFLMTAATAHDLKWTEGSESATNIIKAVDAATSIDTPAGVLYGIDMASTDNLDRYQADKSLFTNAVKLQMMGGKSSTAAIAEVQRAMYGGARVVDQGHAKLVLPASVDADTTVTALSAQLPAVKTALERWGTVDAPGGTPTQKREAQFQTWDRTANINKIVNESGVWRNLGTGYGFMDTTTGLFVAGKDGKPLVVTDDDLSAAAKVQANAAAVQEKAAAVEAAKPVTAIPLGASGESIQLTPDEVKAANPAPAAPAAPAPVAPATTRDVSPTLSTEQKLQAEAVAGGARKAKDGKWYRKNPEYADDPTKPQWIEVKP